MHLSDKQVRKKLTAGRRSAAANHRHFCMISTDAKEAANHPILSAWSPRTYDPESWNLKLTACAMRCLRQETWKHPTGGDSAPYRGSGGEIAQIGQP
ncbi:uncharacterized protein N7529_009957 [Penicillium soppii]|uniref:uncharacterized protein n=1 Tax=Penicillium soppii TaxID=69789 RepID=UPI002548FAD3|nr:uncharacterized protein N7529_009957 [Penicillium soppii]KAJ5856013.1 hypothetical protein N7529_009957 [Penicillium soppii]